MITKEEIIKSKLEVNSKMIGKKVIVLATALWNTPWVGMVERVKDIDTLYVRSELGDEREVDLFDIRSYQE